MTTEPDPKRIAVTMSLYPEEYDLIVKSGRCESCNHLTALHNVGSGPCRVEECECYEWPDERY